MGSTVLIQPGIALLHSFLGLSSHHQTFKMPKKANIFESFSHSAIQQFKEAFGIMDTNKDGLLSSDDLVAAFAAHGKNIGGGEAQAEIMRGFFKGRSGRILSCYRRKFLIHVDRITREKANGATVHVGINPSKVQIIKLKMHKDRKQILERKNRNKMTDKGKYKEEDVSPMADVD